MFAVDADPARAGREPDGPVDAAVLCAPGGAERALEAVEPAGTVLVFADAGALPAEPVYRKELTVARLALGDAARRWSAAVALLPELDVPEPTVLPLARFDEGLERYRRREALKVVFVP